MTYLTANLHGCYSEFMELLRQIKFKSSDVLYVLGDIVDYGEEPIELICDLSMRYNVYAIAGEHDYTAARLLSNFEKLIQQGKTPDPAFVRQMNDWVADGGKPTLDGYRRLDSEMKEGVL
ncbi:MAG TPA: metallophosphoesterase, partial [Bacillota bacterium]|nr:metallophosphoesterase [Bacillota bacterium]